MVAPLEFEKNITALEGKLEELRHISSSEDFNIADEVTRLKKKVEKALDATYSKLTPWQRVQVARHQDRPQFLDYIDHLIDDFIELSGDRNFAEDRALIGGIGRFRGAPVMMIGHQKGRETEERIKHNFGMPKPEGYRKAVRLMKLANQFRLPLIQIIDTSGAYAGVDAEERGQSEALARCLEAAIQLSVPVVSVIAGEGGSGGAVALGVANEIYMLENSIYSVISPEGCASILWRTSEKKEVAAEALKLNAQELLKLKVIDGVIAEPLGGAHRDPTAALNAVADVLEASLGRLKRIPPKDLLVQRREKFLKMGRDL